MPSSVEKRFDLIFNSVYVSVLGCELVGAGAWAARSVGYPRGGILHGCEPLRLGSGN